MPSADAVAVAAEAIGAMRWKRIAVDRNPQAQWLTFD